MKDKICSILGKNIKKYRKLRSLTQEKMTELVGIEVRTLSLIETGNNFVTSKTLEKLAKTLQVSPASLLEDPSYGDTEQLYSDSLKALELIKNNPEKLKTLNYILNSLL